MSEFFDQTRRGLYCRYGCDDENGREWRVIPKADTVAALQLAGKERDAHEVERHGEVFVKPKPPSTWGGGFGKAIKRPKPSV